jgi:hypothetical protein
VNQPFVCNLHHRQGDRWSVVFKIAANLTGKSCRFHAYSSVGTKVIDCDTAATPAPTLTLAYSAIETFVVGVGSAAVTYTGVTTLAPVLTLAQSAALPADTLTYDVEDYTTGDTYVTGTIEVALDASVTTP